MGSEMGSERTVYDMMRASHEEWRTYKTPTNRLYRISNRGGIQRWVKCRTEWKTLRGSISVLGYRYIHGDLWHVLIHQFVAKHFVSNPKHKTEVKHIDGDRLNNNWQNLAFISCS
jgi:hypothetical protein